MILWQWENQMNKNNDDIELKAISVSEMARRLQISRSRLYQLINDGFFLPPVYDIQTKRPYYLGDMIQRNLDAKNKNVGINGQILIFYPPRINTLKRKPKICKNDNQNTSNSCSNHVEILDTLKSLGVELSSKKFNEALNECFPDGIENLDQDEVIRTVFRFIKRQNSEHKQGT